MNVSYVLCASIVGVAFASAQASINFGTASGYAVFATNDVSLSGGSINGSVIAGDTASMSNANISGSFTAGNTVSTNGGTVTGGSSTIQGINFSTAKTEFQQYASSLASLTANGITEVGQWGGITLTGTSDTLNVFNLTAAQIAGSWGITVNATAGSNIVINISGTSAVLSAWLQGSGATAGNVVLNFYEATSVTLQGNTFTGTILAANANTTLQNGNLNGSIITDSFTASNYSLNSYGYNSGSGLSPIDIAGAISAIPEPATLSALAFFGAVMLYRKGRKS